MRRHRIRRTLILQTATASDTADARRNFDWQNGIDRIDVTGWGVDGIADLAIRKQGLATIVTHGTDSVTIRHSAGEIDVGDFLLVA